MATKKAESTKTAAGKPKTEAPKTAKAETPKTEAVKAEAAKAETPKKANSALMKPLTPSSELGEIVGKHALPRTEVVSKVWDYIRKHNLQNPENKREIVADPKLKAVFGKDKATMFEMNKLLSAHLK